MLVLVLALVACVLVVVLVACVLLVSVLVACVLHDCVLLARVCYCVRQWRQLRAKLVAASATYVLIPGAIVRAPLPQDVAFQQP